MTGKFSYPIEIRPGKGKLLSGEYLALLIIGLFGLLMAFIVYDSFKPSSLLDASAASSLTMAAIGLAVATISATRLIDRSPKIIFEADSFRVCDEEFNGRYVLGFLAAFISLLIAEAFLSGIHSSSMSIAVVILCAGVCVVCGWGFFFKRMHQQRSFNWTDIVSLEIRSVGAQKDLVKIQEVGLLIRGPKLSQECVGVWGLDRPAAELVLLFQHHIKGLPPPPEFQTKVSLPVQIRFDRGLARFSFVEHMFLILCLPSPLFLTLLPHSGRSGEFHPAFSWLRILGQAYGFFGFIILFTRIIRRPRKTLAAFRWNAIASSWRKIRDRRPQLTLDKDALQRRSGDQICLFPWADISHIALSNTTQRGVVIEAALNLTMRSSNTVIEIPLIDLDRNPESIYRLSCSLHQSANPGFAAFSQKIHGTA
jgi:hypothetical protein